MVMALLGMQEHRWRAAVRAPTTAAAGRCRRWWRCRRDHVSTELRVKLEHLLEERFRATSVEYHLSADTDPAWFHFAVHAPEGELADVDLEALEHDVVEAARTWDDRLSDALSEQLGAAAGHRLARRYGSALPRLLQERPGRSTGGLRRHRSSNAWGPTRHT